MKSVLIFFTLCSLLATNALCGNFSTDIKPTADALIMKLYPVSNLGRRKFLRAGHDNKGKPMKSLLRFQLPVLKGSLQKAELVLYKCYQNANAKGELKIFEVLSPWTERKVTWKGQPKLFAETFYTGAPLAKAPLGKYSIDITQIVKRWYKDSNKNFGICLYSDAYGYDKQLKFHSRENKFSPVLKLTTTEQLDTNKLLPVNVAMVNFSTHKIPTDIKKKIIAEYKRLPFDKGNYKGTVWSAANPWFRPSRDSVSRTKTYGGTDFAWHNFTDDGPVMWKEIAEKYHKYGITGLQFEITDKAGFFSIFNAAAEGFKLSGNKFRIMPFLSLHPRKPEKMIDYIDGTFEALKKWFADPVTFKVDGHPVIAVYSPSRLKPNDWKLVISTIEKKHGRFIWLFNAAHIKKTPLIKEYVKVFDGTTMYGNWPLSVQKKLFEELAPIMHKEFPEKIFEVATHTNYTVHFHYGGFIPNLTEKFRKSWEIAIAAKPDAITATNWFDIYENSRIMPSYELDDIRLRTLRYYSNLWRKIPPRKFHVPDLYVANFTNVMLGQMLKVEVISFPIKGGGKISELEMQLCRPDGTILYSSPKRSINLNILDSQFFSIPALKFYNEKAVLPRITYKWRNRKFTSPMLPQTNLVTSLRPHLLYWCRSLNNMLVMQFSKDKTWEIDSCKPGQTITLPSNGKAVVHGTGRSTSSGSAKNRAGNWVKLLRNGRELSSFKTLSPWGLNLSVPVTMPSPVGALDWYNLELENFKTGSRYITPPIWVVSGNRPSKITMPILDITAPKPTVKNITIEAVRVPYFYYKCAKSAGRILLDSSGYDHNGMIGNQKVSAGIIQMTLYRHEHTGYSVNVGSSVNIGIDQYPLFTKDVQGRYLQFDGKSHAMIRGGTAFPYAATYELFIKPDDDDSEQYFMGAANGQIILSRFADGKIKMSRLGAIEGEGGSKPKSRTKISIVSKSSTQKGKWSHIAVVYDLNKLYLYVNGKLENSAPCKPIPSQEWIGSLVIGGRCKFPYIALPSFKGGIKKVRIYGRNLSPKEFLINK
jgi:Concanavalin A-like lectin/glucanases superfamily